jgi:hypothetical protein
MEGLIMRKKPQDRIGWKYDTKYWVSSKKTNKKITR